MASSTRSIWEKMILLLMVASSISYSQVRNQEATFEDLIRAPINHESHIRELPERSFYQLREDWQFLIDSTWGMGLPYAEKLAIFESWADIVHDDFGCFTNWEGDWESLRAEYSTLMEDTTLSHGGFAAIMSHMAHDMREYHTFSWDETVINTPLNPGTPLLILGGSTELGHFGAVTTTLADSTLLVLRAIENHPLDLQPGDILLGYEGIMWRDLVFELLDARLPLYTHGSACTATYTFNCLVTMGLNWHLFDTMDVLKYDTGEIVNLSLEPMLDLIVDHPYMANNEQLAVPGVPMPDFEIHGFDLVTHGIIEGTNIGYIYLWLENSYTEAGFGQAMQALSSTDGLIIDLRYNIGGTGTFETGFDALFNSSFFTIGTALRCNTSDFSMCPDGNEDDYQIDGDVNTFYDKPIAILAGHNSASKGDVMTWWLGYQPNSRYFGRPSNASPNKNRSIIDFENWTMKIAIGDKYLVSDPDSFLTGMELPIDDPVWFTPDEVAAGIDGVVESAKSWISNLAYAHNLELDGASYYPPGQDSILITVQVENPEAHELMVNSDIIDSDSSMIAEFALNDDGTEGDLLAFDGIWSFRTGVPETESFYAVSVHTIDETLDWPHHLPKVKRFTTIGPLTFQGLSFSGDSIIYPGDNPQLYLDVLNESDSIAVNDVVVRVWLNDETFAHFSNIHSMKPFGTIEAGATATNSSTYRMYIHDDCSGDTNITVNMAISSHGIDYWEDSFVIYIQPDTTVGVRDGDNSLPTKYLLCQNYPNPFNPSTTISYDLPEQSSVRLTVYDIQGQEITKLVNGVKPSGSYDVKWNGLDQSGDQVSTGVYFCRFQVADPANGRARMFSQTIKMVYLR